ncbi:MAG: FhaA domain-containing protein [Syntrophothermus sp.]
MAWLMRLERWLEKNIEGIFKRGYQGKVQPVELAKQLVRVMEDNKRVSVARTYVPNLYRIGLNKEDYDSLATFRAQLVEELEGYLKKRFKGDNLLMVGPLQIELALQETLAAGQFSIDAEFSPGKRAPEISGQEKPSTEAAPGDPEGISPMEGEVQEERVAGGTMVFSIRHTAVPEEKVVCELTVQAGPEKGRVFRLSPGRRTIGRDAASDIRLADSSVSRRHAVLVVDRAGCLLVDQNSTNGTYVNGVPVKEKPLAGGEQIRVGQTVLGFRVV